VRAVKNGLNTACPDWDTLVKFCYTEAISGGAWIKDSFNQTMWISERSIDDMMGIGWFLHHVKKHGSFTGLWIDIDKNLPYFIDHNNKKRIQSFYR
jgi:hypothetical protein